MAKTKINIEKSMMLITSNWGPYKSFKAIPINKDCPYMEAIFDPSSKVLAVISKHSKQSYHMLPKLDDMGDPIKMKIGKRENGKNFKEQRTLIETYAEYYIAEFDEIKTFLNGFCLNADSFNYTEFMEKELENDIKAMPAMMDSNIPVFK